jgi:ribosome-associated toxin RatA of RatAB toxin-antitoxin module
MPHLSNEILIHAPTAAILAAAYQVDRWPEWLPHYRWTRVTEPVEPGGARTVEMAARKGWIPLRWTALQWKDESRSRVYFRHVRGPTRGMDVVWEIDPAGEGASRVVIRHEFTYPVPLLGPFFATQIVGRFFIRPVASRTLTCFQRLLEATPSALG